MFDSALRRFGTGLHYVLFFLFLVLAGGSWPAATAQAQAKPLKPLDVPYVPTPRDVVALMLEVANVQPSDYVIDLGSGDGRIAIAAVRDRGARGAMGVDIDPVRIGEARGNAEEAGVADKVKFRNQDLFETDFSKASVLTMYLLPHVNLRLRPKVLDLAPGTRVVSHAFDMGDWESDAHRQVGTYDVYLWIVPAKVDGQWRFSEPDGDLAVEFRQEFQKVHGTAEKDGQAPLPLTGELRGSVIRFAIGEGSEVRQHVGRVRGDSIVAIPEDGSVQGWRASRR